MKSQMNEDAINRKIGHYLQNRPALLNLLYDSVYLDEGELPRLITDTIVGTPLQFKGWLNTPCCNKWGWNFLDLKGFKIQSKGAMILAEELKSNTNFTTLKLLGNKIGVTGALALADAFKEKQTLRDIDLSCNHIRNSGAYAIAEALQINQTLKYINIKSNHIGDSGAIALAKALKGRSLEYTTMNLTRNNITSIGMDALHEVSQFHPRLKIMAWMQNPDFNAVSKVLQKERT